jgi:single-strand DNA-binding protein
VEVTKTTSGPAATLRLAVNEKYTTREGEPREKTHWFRVSVWREQADAMRGLTKGTAIYVEGALSEEKWKDRQGNERKGKIIEAQVVYAIAPFSGPARTQGQPASATPRPAPSRAPRAATHERAPTSQVGGVDLPPEEADLPF